MSNRDPYEPSRANDPYYQPPGANPPRHVQPLNSSAWSSATIAGALMGVMLIAAAIFMFATNGGQGDQTAANPPGQTTGQADRSTPELKQEPKQIPPQAPPQ